MRALQMLAVAAGLAATAGCYRGPATDDPASKGGSRLPLGVATPDAGLPSPGPVTGVFATAVPDDPDCCWLGASVSFPVRVRAGASMIRLVTFIPDIKLFRERTQSVTVSADGGPPIYVAGLVVGRHFIDIPVRRSRSARIVRVALEPGFTFVPIREHITPDGRTLSLYLRTVAVR